MIAQNSEVYNPPTYLFSLQVASLASLAQLLPPRSPTCNPVPDSSLCRAAAPRLRPLQLLLPVQLHQSVSTAAELAACIRFSCFSPLASVSTTFRLRPLRLLLPDCICFNCCSPMASASSAAPRLRPLQLLLPDCVHFGCCSPPAVLEDSSHVHYSRTLYAEVQ